MEIQPHLKAARFAQLEPGELFLCPFDTGLSFALKVIDPNAGGDSFILPLGPIFPPESHQPRLWSGFHATTVSFGKNFLFRFSEKADGWLVNEPGHEFYCAALVENEAYLRANGHPYPGRYVDCWIKLDGGIMGWGGLPGIAAYAVKWEILLPDGNLSPRSIVEQSGRPFMSVSHQDNR
jgi:hypothetical protein